LVILWDLSQKSFSLQWNEPSEEDVSYCLSWLSFIIRTLVQSKMPFSNPPMSYRTLCWRPNCHWLITVLSQGNVKLHFELLFTAFLMVVGGGGGVHGKDVEIDESCFSKQKCNCGSFRATAWVFVDVKRELSTPVMNLLLIALPRHCSPSLKVYILPSTTVVNDCCGYSVCLLNEGLAHHAVDRSVIFVAHRCSHKYDRGHIEAHQRSPQALLIKRS
jgi:hypothetical protein